MDTTTLNNSASSSTPVLKISTSALLLGLTRLSSPTAEPLPLKPFLTAIDTNWKRKHALDAFLGLTRFIRPAGEPEDWELALVPTVALLSEALAEQLAEAEQLQEAMQMMGAFDMVLAVIKERLKGKGGDMTVKAEDVLKVLRRLYAEAKEVEESKGKGKGKSKARKEDDMEDVDMDGDDDME